MKAFEHLIRYALWNRCTVSVWDGEEWQVKRSDSFDAIRDAIESVDEAHIHIRDNGKAVAWAAVSAFGLADDETVIDYGDNTWMKEWEKTYDFARVYKGEVIDT